MNLQKDRYPEVLRISSKNEIRDLYVRFGLDIPDGFEDIPEENMVLLKAAYDSELCGMVSGIVLSEERVLKIHRLFLEKKYRSTDNTAFLIKSIYDEAGSLSCVGQVGWRYLTEKKDGKDPYMLICERAGDIPFTVHTIDHVFLMDLHAMVSGRPVVNDYDDDFLFSRGYRTVRCIDATKKQVDDLRSVLKDADALVLSLSPFDGKERDEENSRYIVSNEDERICGWMICRKMEEGLVEIARLFAFADHRKGMTGLYLCANVMKRLEGSYDRAVMKALPQNAQILRLLRGYLGPFLKERDEKLILMDQR